MRAFTIESALRMMAGVVILGALILAQLVTPWFYLLIAIVGVNLVQSSITQWCPAVWAFEKLGIPHCHEQGGRHEHA